MTLITIAVVIIVAGVLLWLVTKIIPMESKLQLLLKVVVIIVLALWVLDAFGLLGGKPHVPQLW
jgi:hypothetical protein